MSSKQPPEWWLKQREPRFGCADVTIVAVAAIAAFIILILILSRADFASIVERVPLGNAATATANVGQTAAVNNNNNPSNPTTSNIPTTPANAVVVTTAPAPATLAPTDTPAFPTVHLSKAVIKNSGCVLRTGTPPSNSAPAISIKAGWHVDVDGLETDAGGSHWKEVIINDQAAGQSNSSKGWIIDSCLTTLS
jgi:hypothetical protein